MKKLTILVCFYNKILLKPKKLEYLNIQCGKDATGVNLDMIADNTGENISSRNQYWSEITGMYWAWKNIEKVDYIGLCSYRRFFNFKKNPISAIKIIPLKAVEKFNIIEIPDVEYIFSKYDVIIPKPYTYAYSIKEICDRNYKVEDFELLEITILKLSPEYSKAYLSVMYSSNKMIGHNMFVMSWEHFDEFSKWVFTILFEMEKKLDPSNYSISQIRVFGYMHELLLAVYIEKKKLRKYYSQIIWATDSSKGFKFNNIFYKLAAAVYYNCTKVFNQNNVICILFSFLISNYSHN